jgi:glycerophosphoryl diester phosphodiesterase
MLIIGHRGAAGLESENTLGSLKKAEEAGVGMAEFDFRQTKDGYIVAMHDAALTRTHDERKRVSQLTLNEVKEIGIREAREIPTLEEILASAKIPLNLEIKETGFEDKVATAIKNFPHKLLVSSSNPVVLKKIRSLDGKVNLGFILGLRWGYWFPFAMGVARTLDLYSINPYHSLVTPRHMKAMRELKVKVYPWTVDDVHHFEIMKGFGVDGIFTDYPDRFKNRD